MVRRILLLTAILFAVSAVPAHAGGPTSVLLSSPPHVIGLGYEDPLYTRLQPLVQTEVVVDDSTDNSHASGRFVRATWLIHDMSVWRIDVIYPDADGGPWIETQSLTDESNPGKPVWHKAVDPAGLLRVLGELKLLGGKFQGGPSLTDYTYTEPAPTPAPQPTPEPAVVQPQAQAASTFFTGWRWTIPGVLLGAAVTALVLRLYPKRRWELMD